MAGVLPAHLLTHCRALARAQLQQLVVQLWCRGPGIGVHRQAALQRRHQRGRATSAHIRNLAPHRLLARHQLQQQNAHAVDVRLLGTLQPQEQFWGCVCKGACSGDGGHVFVTQQLGQPHIGDLGAPLLRQQHIRTLQVPVNDFGCVNMAHATQNVAGEVEPAAAPGELPSFVRRKCLPQIATLAELEDHRRCAVSQHNPEQLHHIHVFGHQP
mmetsp:Transcript_3995/g.11608  ORF Transcript_3995/g.11608 Transcript_3995/m.11608 type:complete len:213 (+) Transcript_3995:1113-1751(+)